MAARRQSSKPEPQMPKSIAELGKLTNATAKRLMRKAIYLGDPVLSGIRKRTTATATSVADGLHLSNLNLGKSGKAASNDFGAEGIIEDPECDPTSGWARMTNSSPGAFVKGAGQVWTFNGQTLLIVTSRSSADRDKLGIHAMQAETGVWQSLDYLRQPPSVRFGHSAVIAGDTLFVFGGWSRDDVYNETYCVDLVRRSKKASWTAPTFSGPVCPKRAHHSAVLLGDDTMLVFGGSTYDRWKAYSYLNDTWTLDLINFKWQQLKTFGAVPNPRSQHTAVAFPRSDGGTDMIVFGGATSHWIMDDFYYFSMQNHTWYPIDTTHVCPFKKILSQHTEYKPPIAHRPAVVFQGSIYIYGGGSTTDDAPSLFGVDLVQELDPSTRLPTGNLHLRWSYLLLRYYPRRWYHMLLLRPDGGLFLVGGADDTIEGHCDKVRKKAFSSVYWLDLNRFTGIMGAAEAVESGQSEETSSRSSSFTDTTSVKGKVAKAAAAAAGKPGVSQQPPGLNASTSSVDTPVTPSVAAPAAPADVKLGAVPTAAAARGQAQGPGLSAGGGGGGGGRNLTAPNAAASFSSSRHLSAGSAFKQMQASLRKSDRAPPPPPGPDKPGRDAVDQGREEPEGRETEADDDEEDDEDEENQDDDEPDETDDDSDSDCESQESSDSFKTDPGFTLSDPMGGDVAATNRAKKQQQQHQQQQQQAAPARQAPEASFFSAFLSPRQDPACTADSSASFGTSPPPQSPSLRRRSLAKKQIGAHVPVHTSKMIGKGTFGKVYLGLHPHTGEFVAVKQMRSQGLSTRDKEKIAAEIDLLRDLEHENVVGYLGTYVKDGKVNIVMEYVTGGALLGLIEQYKGGLPEIVCQRYTRQIVLGIEYLHSRRLMHRDIKPANILVDAAGICKVADFGASKHLTAATRTTMFQTANAKTEIAGTPLYMAPEMISGMTTDLKSDVWGIGCTVVEMLDGRRPWHHVSHLEAIPLCMFIASSDSSPVLPKQSSDSARSFLSLCFHRDLSLRHSCTQLLQDPWIASQDDEDTEGGAYPSSPRSTRLKNRRASAFEALPPPREPHPPSESSCAGDEEPSVVSSAGANGRDRTSLDGKPARSDPFKDAFHDAGPPQPAKPKGDQPASNPAEPEARGRETSELEKRMLEMQANMTALQDRLVSHNVHQREMITQRDEDRSSALERQLQLQQEKHEEQMRMLREQLAAAAPAGAGHEDRPRQQDAARLSAGRLPSQSSPYNPRSCSSGSQTASPPRHDDGAAGHAHAQQLAGHAAPHLARAPPPLQRPGGPLPQPLSGFAASIGRPSEVSCSPRFSSPGGAQYLQQLRPDVSPEYRFAVQPFFEGYEDPEADLSDLDM
ncbi:Mitogen-activated protein kinase kinase kinase ANP1 [Diplonema papillatum]|nr:Mitogen-activated protein kinase kinase kinase ANP1 [Diplonema papillatum]